MQCLQVPRRGRGGGDSGKGGRMSLNEVLQAFVTGIKIDKRPKPFLRACDIDTVLLVSSIATLFMLSLE